MLSGENPSELDETKINLILEVEDTGIGIPKEQQEHIFGAFSQVSGQSTRKFGGTGLGLTITKRLTEMMHGVITVRSESGKGSTFRFVFPHVAISELAETSPVIAGGEGDFSQFAPATILVADDVALNRALLTGYFEGTPHKLITATNGREALELAERHRPDVILMDMRMPDLNGYEASALLKASAALKHIPVIAVTASSFRKKSACAESLPRVYPKTIQLLRSDRRIEALETRAAARKSMPADTLRSAPPWRQSRAVEARPTPELLAKLRGTAEPSGLNFATAGDDEIEYLVQRLQDGLLKTTLAS
jgi:CheY-like chemotaxis protein